MDIIMISIGLAMDAFSISICKGLSMKNRLRSSLIIASYFGLFQMIMPLIGYFIGYNISSLIYEIDHWIIFIILSFLGIDMLFHKNNNYDDNTSFYVMFPLAIATSIDALAVGVTFSFLNTSLFSSILIIGIITFILSFIGCFLGSKIGEIGERYSLLIGGIILILIGLKILISHLGIFIFF